MKNPLPTEELVMSMEKGDTLTLMGQQFELKFYTTRHNTEHWYFDRKKTEEEKACTEPYEWVHLRSLPGEGQGMGIAAFEKPVLAKMVATGEFYIG